jgi:acyl carrier protein
MSAPSSELDSVSTTLLAHPDVVDAVMFRTRRREPALRVVAIVPDPLASVVDLRDHLWETLPAADLPELLVPMDELPRDGAGAVDVDRIEAEFLDAPGVCTFRPPDTPTEVTIAQVWREVLGRARVGADDNFLDLGGDSMTAALLLDLTNERLGVDLSLNDLLAAPSLAALAESVDAAS